MQKVRGLFPTACMHSILGSVSPPFMGAFHLSLAVLVRYQSLELYLSLGWWNTQGVLC